MMTLVVASGFSLNFSFSFISFFNFSFGSARVLVPNWSGDFFFQLLVLLLVSLDNLESLPQKIEVKIFFLENDLKIVFDYLK